MTPRPDPRSEAKLPVKPPLPAPPPAPRVHAPRGVYQPNYVTRKRLDSRELLTAAGAGVALGLAAFYLAKVWLERTPVLPPEPGQTITPQRAAT